MWKTGYKLLFDEGVLRTLPPPLTEAGDLPGEYLDVLHRRSYSESLGRGKVSLWDIALGKPALALYAAYSRKPAPEFFLESQDAPDTSTFALSASLGRSLFKYQFPQLAFLTPD